MQSGRSHSGSQRELLSSWEVQVEGQVSLKAKRRLQVMEGRQGLGVYGKVLVELQVCGQRSRHFLLRKAGCTHMSRMRLLDASLLSLPFTYMPCLLASSQSVLTSTPHSSNSFTVTSFSAVSKQALASTSPASNRSNTLLNLSTSVSLPGLLRVRCREGRC